MTPGRIPDRYSAADSEFLHIFQYRICRNRNYCRIGVLRIHPQGIGYRLAKHLPVIVGILFFPPQEIKKATATATI